MKGKLKLVLACLCLVAQGAMAQQTNRAKYFMLINEGNKLLAKKDSLEAVTKYMAAIEVAPDTPEPYEKVAEVYSKMQDPLYQRVAKDHYEKFLKLTKDAAAKQKATAQLAAIDRYLKENGGGGGTAAVQTNTVATTAKPVVNPAKPVPTPAKPVVSPAKPVATPAKPVAEVQIDSTKTIIRQDGSSPFGGARNERAAELAAADSTMQSDSILVVEEPPVIKPEDDDSPFASLAFEPERVRKLAFDPLLGDSLMNDSLANDSVAMLRRLALLQLQRQQRQQPQQEADNTTANDSVAAAPQETGRRNPFKKRTDNKPVKQVQQMEFDFKNDPLYKAYLWKEEDTDRTQPLLSFQKMVEAPLASELEAQTAAPAESTTKVYGNWASTLRNTANMRELFVLKVPEAGGNVAMQKCSDIISQGKKNGLVGSITAQNVSEKAMSLRYEYSFDNTLPEVERFVQLQIAPYLGTVVQANRFLIHELKDNADAKYKTSCTIDVNLKAAKKALCGTLALSVNITDSEGNKYDAISANIPCAFYSVGDDYAGFDASQAQPYSLETDSVMLAEINAIKSKSVKDANDKNNLGYCYLNGKGTAKDLVKAARYFEEAANEGCIEAYTNMSLVYLNGWGDKKRDYTKALEMLAKGREAKSPCAICESADLMLDAPFGQPQQSYIWFDKLYKDTQNPYAAYRVGQMQTTGHGTVKNESAARKQFEDGRAKGFVDSNYELAKMALRDKKANEAYGHATRGAQDGSMLCMQLLAEMYLTNVGVRTLPNNFNLKTGINWLVRKAEASQKILVGYEHVEKKY